MEGIGGLELQNEGTARRRQRGELVDPLLSSQGTSHLVFRLVTGLSVSHRW